MVFPELAAFNSSPYLLTFKWINKMTEKKIRNAFTFGVSINF